MQSLAHLLGTAVSQPQAWLDSQNHFRKPPTARAVPLSHSSKLRSLFPNLPTPASPTSKQMPGSGGHCRMMEPLLGFLGCTARDWVVLVTSSWGSAGDTCLHPLSPLAAGPNHAYLLRTFCSLVGTWGSQLQQPPAPTRALGQGHRARTVQDGSVWGPPASPLLDLCCASSTWP